MSFSYPDLFHPDARIARSESILCESFTSPELLIPRLSADSKIGAIKELLDRLHAASIVSDSLSFLQAVLERENLQSTILCDEVALPHARIRTVNRLGMAMGIARRPIDFPSGDQRQAIRFICLIAVPVYNPGLYLELQGGLARTFSDPEIKKALLHATAETEIYHHLSSQIFI